MSSCAESGWPIREHNYDPNGNRLLEFADGVKTATTVGDNNQLTAVGDEDFMTDFFGNTVDINDGITDQFFEYNWERAGWAVLDITHVGWHG